MRAPPTLRVFTNSERGALACPKLHGFAAIDGLTTSMAAAPLRHGSLVHSAVDAWCRTGCRATADDLQAAVIDPWLEARRAWADRLGTEEAGAQYDEDKELAVLTAGMMRGYVEEHASDADEWEWLAIEGQVARWLEHPKKGGPMRDRLPMGGLRRWAFGGKIDRLARHRSTGAIWQWETKTTKETNLDNYVRKLHWDPQIRGYAWALLAPIPEYSHPAFAEPIHIEGVVYDVLRKSVPRKPDVLKDGTRLSKAAIDTTRKVFLETILEHGFDPDDYADQLERLSAVRFFQRERYSFTEAELDDFGVDTAWSALAAQANEKATFRPRQTRVCRGGPAASGCPGGFDHLCLQDGVMARKAFTVMTIRHPELDGDLAEPWAGKARGIAEAPVAAPEPDHEEPAPAHELPTEEDMFGPPADETTTDADAF